ncbi:MAG: NAD(+) diphosphatase [Chitinispirillaceae bacterium]|nr:NAD(+) diphosphatase [Chitinispirillaceae bacterium]
MPFISSFIPPADRGQPAWWFIFQHDRLLVSRVGDSARVPLLDSVQPFGIDPQRAQFLGMLDTVPCYAASIDSPPQEGAEGMTVEPLRRLFGLLPEEQLRIAIRASQIVHWDNTSRYCGACGGPTRPSAAERAKMCQSCGLTLFPRISPAVIVAVVNDDRILLAHGSRYPEGLYSVLAGFVEPGETIEECVAREVKEEVGIDVSDIRYFASQPWPFPDSLMVAFTARYAGGEIIVDGKEVDDAGWFSADSFPRIPEAISISRRLIDWFVEQQRSGGGAAE